VQRGVATCATKVAPYGLAQLKLRPTDLRN
jgi:hypothetical protein